MYTQVNHSLSRNAFDELSSCCDGIMEWEGPLIHQIFVWLVIEGLENQIEVFELGKIS